MTTCNASPNTTPCHTATPGERLRLARLALKAKQDEISALWELNNRQVISDWERGRAVVPDEMLPKIEQLEVWAAAGGNLDAVRTEIARVKDRELAAQIERAHSKATTWQALGSRPVPLIEQPAQLTLEGAAPTTPAPRPEPVAAAAAPSPDTYTTINWESFVVELDGVRGISLRELVERGGLYSKIEHAVRALLRSGLDFYSSEVKVAMGRPRKEYLFRSVNDAIEFCIIAASPTAHQIRRLLMAHHLEFQRLIAGDAAAKGRLADAQATHERIEAQPPAPTPALSPMMVALQAALEHEAKIIQLQHDVAELQRAEAIRREESERMLARLKGAGLPEPAVDAPALTTRKAIVAQLARVGVDAGNEKGHHHTAWVHLYSQYEHRAGVDLKLRAKNAGQTVLDYAETHGHLDALYALACELWPTDGAGARA